MSKKAYNVITGICVLVLLLTAIFYGDFPQYKLWFIGVTALAGLVSVVTYVRNATAHYVCGEYKGEDHDQYN